MASLTKTLPEMPLIAFIPQVGLIQDFVKIILVCHYQFIQHKIFQSATVIAVKLH
jgi:hypothetical protein